MPDCYGSLEDRVAVLEETNDALLARIIRIDRLAGRVDELEATVKTDRSRVIDYHRIVREEITELGNDLHGYNSAFPNLWAAIKSLGWRHPSDIPTPPPTPAPYKMAVDSSVPDGELWMRDDATGEVKGKITGIGEPTPAPDDAAEWLAVAQVLVDSFTDNRVVITEDHPTTPRYLRMVGEIVAKAIDLGLAAPADRAVVVTDELVNNIRYNITASEAHIRYILNAAADYWRAAERGDGGK